MYAIGRVIYGAPITQKIADIAAARDEELDSEDGGYFTTLYNGGGSTQAGYIGVELAYFDECSNFPFSNLTRDIEISDSQEVHDKLQLLPEAYRKVLPAIQRWVVWSSS